MRLACYLMFPRAAGENPRPVNESEHPQSAPQPARDTRECVTLTASRRRSPAHAAKRRAREHA